MQEVPGSILTAGNFFAEFILFLPTKGFIANIANFVQLRKNSIACGTYLEMGARFLVCYCEPLTVHSH